MAGRPKKSEYQIYDAKDRRLDWFKLKNYKSLSDLTALGWYFQIQIRRDFLCEIESLREFRDTPEEFALRRERTKWSAKSALFREHPVVTLQILEESGLDLSDFFTLEHFLYDPDPVRFVRPLSVREFLDIDYKFTVAIGTREMDMEIPVADYGSPGSDGYAVFLEGKASR